jgi:branched-chain amino acid transport system permease protein
MVTLAAASVMMVLASQMSEFTGGEDGITYQIPRFFAPANRLRTPTATSCACSASR